jgi:hypothetical protein
MTSVDIDAADSLGPVPASPVWPEMVERDGSLRPTGDG